jgi:hypothetical protein
LVAAFLRPNGLARFLNDAWAGIQVAWVEMVRFLGTAWTNFIGVLQKAWNRFSGFFQKCVGAGQERLHRQGRKRGDRPHQRRDRRRGQCRQRLLRRGRAG